MGLQYIWVACDNILALSGEYDTRISYEETNEFQLHVFYSLLGSIYSFPKQILKFRYTQN